MSTRIAAFTACTLSLFGASCGGATPTPVTPTAQLSNELVDAEGKPAPQWVTAPTAYRKDAEGAKVVCGEGSINGTRNMNMAQSASAGRARTNLARALETRVTAMLKDYQATTSGGEQFGASSNDEQHVQDASKQITQTTLSGTEVNETWIAASGSWHSLVCLNLERFKGLVQGMSQLNEQIRAAVTERAERAWEELDNIPPAHEGTELSVRDDASSEAQ